MCLILRMLATNRIVDVTITLKPSWLRRAHNAPYRFSFAVKEHSIRQSSTDSVTYIRMYRSIRFDILWCGRLVYRLEKLTLDKIYLNDRKSLMFQCFQESFIYTMQYLHAYLDTRMWFPIKMIRRPCGGPELVLRWKNLVYFMWGCSSLSRIGFFQLHCARWRLNP